MKGMVARFADCHIPTRGAGSRIRSALHVIHYKYSHIFARKHTSITIKSQSSRIGGLCATEAALAGVLVSLGAASFAAGFACDGAGLVPAFLVWLATWGALLPS